MKKIIYIAIILSAMATFLITSCATAPKTTPLSNTIDSVHNGSSFTISYTDSNGVYWVYSSKAVSFGGLPVVSMTASVVQVDTAHDMIAINVSSPYSVGGITVVNFNLLDNGMGGTGTGTFAFASPSSFGKSQSEFGQVNPYIVFSDSSGTATITHNGSDYIEGTFTTNIYFNGYAGTYYATGDFTIYH